MKKIKNSDNPGFLCYKESITVPDRKITIFLNLWFKSGYVLKNGVKTLKEGSCPDFPNFPDFSLFCGIFSFFCGIFPFLQIFPFLRNFPFLCGILPFLRSFSFFEEFFPFLWNFSFFAEFFLFCGIFPFFWTS